MHLENANEGHKKKVVFVGVTVSLATAVVSGILILAWCHRQKSQTNIKGVVSLLKSKIESLNICVNVHRINHITCMLLFDYYICDNVVQFL
jgi:cytochrome b subunit of formate dehydrogenase